MKKYLAVLLTLTMLACCVGASAQTTLVYWDHFGEESKTNGVDALVARFEELYPEYTVEVSHMTYDTMLDMIRVKVAAGDPPDVFQGNTSEFPELIKAGEIFELTDQPYASRINEAARREASIDGHLWSLPTDLEVRCNIYNKEVFEKNGIAMPTTRSEFEAACEKLDAAGVMPVGIGLVSATMCLDVFEFLAHPRLIDAGMNDFAAKIMSDEMNFADNDLYKLALKDFNEQFLAYTTENVLSVDRPEMLVGVANGSIAVCPTGNCTFGDIRANNPDGEFGVMPFTVFDEADKNGIILGIDDVFMIPTQAGSIEGANAYLDFITTEEGVNIWHSNSQMLTAVEGVAVDNLDPMNVAVQEWINNGGKCYYRADISKWQGVDYTTMQTLMQSYVALSEAERTDYDNVVQWLDEELEAMR